MSKSEKKETASIVWSEIPARRVIRHQSMPREELTTGGSPRTPAR
jgi:hypothetical protein